MNNLNKPTKIVLGVLTILPVVIIAGLLLLGFIQVISILSSEEPFMPLMYLSYLSYVIPFLFIYSVFYLGLGIFYLIHIINNPLLDTEKKGLWITVLIILNGISMPVYWYIHLWKSQSGLDVSRQPEVKVSHESQRT